MAAVNDHEVVPGIVIHLNPEKLTQLGGCEVRVVENKEVQGDHYFLILKVDPPGVCSATPLCSDNTASKSRIKLDNSFKTGKKGLWSDRDTYYYKWQLWRFPVFSVKSSSTDDNTTENDRRYYAKDNSKILEDMFNEMNTSWEKWRQYKP
jgi:hypothetical protein